MRSDLEDVLVAIDLSRKTFQRIRLNYVWALGYNVVMIPVAAGLLYPTLRMQIPPWIAGTLGLLVAADVLCKIWAIQKGPVQQVHRSVGSDITLCLRGVVQFCQCRFGNQTSEQRGLLWGSQAKHMLA